jgi:hypothetical protein
MKSVGITNWIAKKRPMLSIADAQNRLKFAREMKDFGDWRRTYFSDECSFERGSGKDREWAFRLPNEQWNHNMIQETRKGHDISQMFFAFIWFKGRSELIKIERELPRGYTATSYIQALEESLLHVYKPGYLWQQDNATIHVARPVKEWFERYGIWNIKWPANSPDLNPIENIWWTLKREVHKRYPTLETMGRSEAAWTKFIACCQEVWNQLDQELIRAVVDSMPRRIDAVIKAKGWQTKY